MRLVYYGYLIMLYLDVLVVTQNFGSVGESIIVGKLLQSSKLKQNSVISPFISISNHISDLVGKFFVQTVPIFLHHYPMNICTHQCDCVDRVIMQLQQKAMNITHHQFMQQCLHQIMSVIRIYIVLAIHQQVVQH